MNNLHKNIFIICSIRNASPEYINKIENYVSKLEYEGYRVYDPHRDTNQLAMGFFICKQNLEGMRNADEVHVFYSSSSQGTHFDMGIAFALNKKIVVVENEQIPPGKSFQKMLVEWSN